ncbi:MAG TPA: hypothetical protein PK467_16070 [Candidatus Wallbacteria bacterium]|nr:hypothetical protein [Candidatus Wallbacteria bacterium]
MDQDNNKGREVTQGVNNGEDKFESEIGRLFASQAAADEKAEISSIRNMEYARITGAHGSRGVSFYYFLSAFLVLFIIFMAYNISQVANEKLSSGGPGGYFNAPYEPESPAGNNSAAGGGRIDPLNALVFFALEGAVIFVLIIIIRFLLSLVFFKSDALNKKINILT